MYHIFFLHFSQGISTNEEMCKHAHHFYQHAGKSEREGKGQSVNIFILMPMSALFIHALVNLC